MKFISFMQLRTLAALVLMAAFPILASAQTGGSFTVGGNLATSTKQSYTKSEYLSVGSGSASSESGGGGYAETAVHGTGASTQYNSGYVNTAAGSAVKLGPGYVNTQTSGSNTAANNSVGVDYGSANGSSGGRAGGDYSSKAEGAYTGVYTSKNSETKNSAGVKLEGYATGTYLPYLLGAY